MPTTKTNKNEIQPAREASSLNLKFLILIITSLEGLEN